MVLVRLFYLLLLLLSLLLVGGTRMQMRADDFQGATHIVPFDEDTIKYSRTSSTGAVARLQDRINNGEVHLKFDPKFGYLPALLEQFHALKSSQVLVFSKTSFQRERISPKRPRSLFFTDDVYLGYIPGSPLLEVSIADPMLGGVFYTLAQTETAKPKFVRTDQCLECHASAKSMGVPGHLLRSFETDEDGVTDLNTGTSQVNHRTPIEERWGGWFVTGQPASPAHRGNLFGKTAFEHHAKDPSYVGTVTNLQTFFDASNYATPKSDIVALMILEHQTHMHNFITRLKYEATIALQTYGHINYLRSPIESFLRYMLFTEEAPIKTAIAGDTSFAKDFAALGPADKQGRSLRELDLHTRLFRYPCSYLIYSEAFDALPKELKTRIYQRLHEILTGKDDSADFRCLDKSTRVAILQILGATKSDLPAFWKTGWE